MKTIIIIGIVIVFRYFILNIISGFLYSLLNILNSFVVSFKYRKDGMFRKWGQYNFDSAFNLDVYGQYNLRTLWNILFFKGGFKFGTNIFETISGVLGFKKLEKTLSYFGLFIYYFLYLIDISKWFKRGHCYCSIDFKLHEHYEEIS